MTRVLITGAAGDLGRPLSALSAQRFETISVFHRRTTVGGGQAVQVNLALREPTLTIFEAHQPDVVIHAAVSDRSNEMVATNRASALHVLSAAQTVGARLIALSTDMVFDGTNPPYLEDSPPSPRSLYGQVKAKNEQLFAQHDNCVVVRTSLIYDFAPENRQMGWLLHSIRVGQPIPLFIDEMRQPIWSWNLAEALLELVENRLTGILNVAGPQLLNRWDYGTFLIKWAGFEPEQVAYRASAAETHPQRPRNCELSLERATRCLATPLLTMQDSLEQAKQRH